MQAAVAKAPAFAGKFHQPLLQAVLLPLRAVVQHAARQPEQAARTTFGQIDLGPHGHHGITSRLRGWNFSRATTFSPSMSSIASASIFLSLAFSASSAFRRFASGTPCRRTSGATGKTTHR